MFQRRRKSTRLAAAGTLVVLLAGCSPSGPTATTLGTEAPAAKVAETQPAPLGGLVATYRGDPARTGRMPGPGPAGDPSVIWTFEADGRFANSPVIAAGIVYAAGGDGVVHALDLRTGAERWSKALDAAVSASPLIAAGRLIVGDAAGAVHAFGLEDGAPAWSVSVDGALTGSAAVVGDDLVIATQAGRAYRLAAATGDILWSVDVGAPVLRSVAVDTDRAYLGATGDLVALSLADGTQRWRVQLAASGDVGTPTVADGMVFAASGIGANDRDDFGVVAVDASSGDVRWSYKSPEGAVIYTPAIGDGKAFVIGHDRLLIALGAGTGEQLWSLDMGAELEALPAIVDDVVYVVGNGGPAVAVDMALGRQLWNVPIEGVPFAPAVVDGYVVVGTDTGMLYAIGGSR